MGRRSFKKKIKNVLKMFKKSSKKGRIKVRQKGSNDSIAEYCIMAKVRKKFKIFFWKKVWKKVWKSEGGEGRGGRVENCHSNTWGHQLCWWPQAINGRIFSVGGNNVIAGFCVAGRGVRLLILISYVVNLT
jgi:hypothetical protein